MNIPVVTVGDAPEDLVGGLERLHGPVTVVRRCAELPELLAACQSGLARAAVIAEGSSGLTATLVDRLAAVGVAVLVLTDDAEEARRLRGIGAAVAGRSTGSAVLAEKIAEAVAARSGHRGAGARGQGTTADGRSGANGARSAARPTTDGRPRGHVPGDGARADVPGSSGPASAGGWPGSHGGPAGGNPEDRDPQDGGQNGGQDSNDYCPPEAAGRILAVWGPAGAPGRTMVAVNIAAELAAAGESVLLIDADSYGASIAASLGLLDESAGLAQACRLADQGMLDAGSLRRVASDVVFKGGQMRVLTGLTRPDRWPELRSAALGLVLEVCRDTAQVTVIDCGFCLESDEELSYDTLAPRRNAATLTSLAAADSIIAVGCADTIGLPRLVRGLAELAAVTPGAAVPGAEPVVVLNKVRKAAAGRGPEKALRLAWDRFGPGMEIGHFLPWEPDAADKTMLAGQLLLESAPDSALRHAIASIVCAPVQRKRRSAVTTSTANRLVSR